MDPGIARRPPAPAPPNAAQASARERPEWGRDTWSRLGGLAAVAGVTAYVGVADPARGGAYPVCPSRFLLGLDCPACGGLRGTHDLLHGDVASALDHNLLLPLWLAVFGVALAVWAAPLLGRAVPAVRPPRWLVATGVAVAGAFAVLRNLPVAGLEFLASGG
jgi:Protein of unknown function (DUF2752)